MQVSVASLRQMCSSLGIAAPTDPNTMWMVGIRGSSAGQYLVESDSVDIQVRDLTPDKYKLRAFYIGYRQLMRLITITDKNINLREIKLENTPLNEPILIVRPETETKIKAEAPIINEPSLKENDTELQQKSIERIKKLRELSTKIKTRPGLTELENEPAYLRRNVVLDNVVPSSETNISRYTLNEGDDNKGELKSNNSFLHDKPD